MDSNSKDRISLTGTTSRRRALKFLGGGALMGVGFAAATSAVAHPPGRANLLSDLPISGRISETGAFEEILGNLSGSATVTQLSVGGPTGLIASGTVTGNLADFIESEGSVTTFQAPVTLSQVEGGTPTPEAGAFTQQEETCRVLYLALSPIYLDLLGLVVDTTQIDNQIQLEIRAEEGDDNLLGNLLCSVAGLLDDDGGDGGDEMETPVSRINELLAEA